MTDTGIKKKITVCVTGEYDEKTKEITGGDDVEIKAAAVDGTNFTGVNAVDEALKQLKPDAAEACCY